jgi:hypothetical protein
MKPTQQHREGSQSPPRAVVLLLLLLMMMMMIKLARYFSIVQICVQVNTAVHS